MYSPTPSLTSALGGVGDQRHAPAALPPGKTRYPLHNNNNNNRNTALVECKIKGDDSNNRGDWHYVKVIQKIREQHTGKT